MAGQTYTDEQRAEAVACYQEHGTAETSRLLEIPRTTIIDWASKADVIVRTVSEKTLEARAVRHEAKRAEMRELLLDRAVGILERMEGPGKPGDMRNMAISVGILIDKYRLEMGETTSRTFIEGTDDVDRRISQLVAEMESRSQASALESALAGRQTNGADPA